MLLLHYCEIAKRQPYENNDIIAPPLTQPTTQVHHCNNNNNGRSSARVCSADVAESTTVKPFHGRTT